MDSAALARFLKEDVHILRSSNRTETVALLFALDCAMGLLLEVASAASLFLNLKDKEEYVLYVITQDDLTRLEEALAKVRGIQ